MLAGTMCLTPSQYLLSPCLRVRYPDVTFTAFADAMSSPLLYFFISHRKARHYNLFSQRTLNFWNSSEIRQLVPHSTAKGC